MTDTCNIKSPLSDKELLFFLIKNDNCVCEFMRQSKYWEGDLCKLMDELVTPMLNKDSKILDVGSFIGTHSIALSDKFKDTKIISIEANPSYLDVQTKNIKINNCENITCINAIVTNNEYLDKLSIPNIDMSQVNNYGGIGVVFKDNDLIQPKNITIDSLNIDNLKLFKLDVEGHELQVLDGALTTIKENYPLIFIEIWSQNLKEYIMSDIFKELFKLNYKVYRVKFSVMDYVLINQNYSYNLPSTLELVKLL